MSWSTVSKDFLKSKKMDAVEDILLDDFSLGDDSDEEDPGLGSS